MTPLPKAILTVLLLAFLSLLVLAIFRSQHNRHIEKQWRRLDVASSEKVFDPNTLANTPAPAARYFMRSLKPGNPLATTVRLRMKGQFHSIENNRRLPLMVSQLLTPQHGFVWEARVRTGIGFITASDYYIDGARRTRAHFLGLIPTTPDFSPTRYIAPETSIERMAMDTIFCPAALLPRPGVSWHAVDDTHARVELTIQKNKISMLFQIDQEGRLTTLVVENISANKASKTGNTRSLQVRIADDHTFESTTIPSKFLVRWSEKWVANGQTTTKDYDILELEVIEAWFK